MVTEALKVLKSLPIAKGLFLKLPDTPYFLDLELQLEPIWLNKPQILTFLLEIRPRE